MQPARPPARVTPQRYVAPQLTPLGRWATVTLIQSVPITGQFFTPRDHQ
ncbi:hypothetical protein [Deinococcus radiotolerans]|nr:hypothetical protein [Deinococcus radiotolerans]